MTFSFKNGRKDSFVRLSLTQNTRHALSRLSIMPNIQNVIFWFETIFLSSILARETPTSADPLSKGLHFQFLSLFGALMQGKISVYFVKTNPLLELSP